MARKLYFGGKILTMDRKKPEAEALLTENGKILPAALREEMKTAG